MFDIDLLELMSLGDGHVILVSDSKNNAYNIIGSSTEIAFEVQKLKM